MQYPENIESKLGFDKIKDLLIANCSSTLGTEFVAKIKMVTEIDKVKRLCLQALQFKTLLETEDSFPHHHFLDVRESLHKIKVEGVFLDEEELHDIRMSLKTIIGCLRFFEQKSEVYDVLFQLSKGIHVNKQIVTNIDNKLDDQGKLKPNATPELAKIRQSLQSEQIKLRKQLNHELRQSIKSGYVAEDANITIRAGRMVIPVLAEHKRRIKGFVHDESSGGQLVYLEPATVLEVNNSIKELEYEEKREIIRILTLLTDQLRPELEDLTRAYRYLGVLDFIRAKAKLALTLEAVMPDIQEENHLEWIDAKHPLLFLSFKSLGKSVVPLQIRLEKDKRILVISGPNAGGKSVCLQTVGLLQYMFQCGLLIPLQEGSKISVFKNLFIDIGDEQSIENDLSTYSSHLKNMKFFLKHGDGDTLFLIDEFGTGTDPNFGGVIAEKILERLNTNKAFGVVNTHYSNLKQFAEQTEGIINGAMRFDMKNLEPLYKLEIGKPGSSFALEIAYKIGLPHDLINNVKESLGDQKVNFDKLLARLERDKLLYEERKLEAKKKDRQLKKLLEKYNALQEELETQKKTIINQAKETAKQLIADSNQKIEATIKSIKENKAEKTATKEVRKSLDNFNKHLKIDKPKKPKPTVEVIDGPITVGSYVRIKGQNTMGEVIGMKGKDVEISIGELSSKVKLNRLEKISKKVMKKEDRQSSGSSIANFDLREKHMTFKSQIDLRGKRTEEALPLVDQLIDDALVTGAKELKIIHGKGDGILRTLIRQHLTTYKDIKNIRDEHADRGGAGITLFDLT